MIEITSLCAGYDGNIVLKDISLTIPGGKLTALLGQNGCGKTTLLKTAARQLPMLSGDIKLNNRSIKEFGRREFARTASFLPQTRNIPEITVGRLVEHGRFPYMGFSRKLSAADRAAIDHALRKTGVERWAERDLRELSGGERQRAYIAMLLAQESAVMLLDEPTAYLDAGHCFELLELLRELCKTGKTIVMVLHDLAHAAQYSDYMALLRPNAPMITGTPTEILESGAITSVFGVSLCRSPDGSYYVKR